MNKAVLFSIRPEWCAKILSGEKTVELRKTAPDIPTPFKCYIYETKGKTSVPWMDEDGHMIFKGRGLVVAEFICPEVEPFSAPYPAFMEQTDPIFLEKSCLTYWDVHQYLGQRTGKGIHIADLKIYDRPKELGEFKRWNRTEENVPCAHMKWLYEPCETCKECGVRHPPQSYMFVEELK